MPVLEGALGIAAVFYRLGILDGDKEECDECKCEHTHCDEEDGVHVHYLGLMGEGADKGAHKHGGEGAEGGVECAADLDVLVGAGAAEKLEHGVHHGVEHADGEAAYECTCKIHEEACGNTGAAHGNHAGQELDEYADETDRNCDKRGFLVTVLCEHVSCGDAHEGVSEEIHHVTHHTKGVGALDAGLHLPDVADRGGQIGDEGDHTEEEDHRQYCNEIAVAFVLRHN